MYGIEVIAIPYGSRRLDVNESVKLYDRVYSKRLDMWIDATDIPTIKHAICTNGYYVQEGQIIIRDSIYETTSPLPFEFNVERSL